MLKTLSLKMKKNALIYVLIERKIDNTVKLIFFFWFSKKKNKEFLLILKKTTTKNKIKITKNVYEFEFEFVPQNGCGQLLVLM